VNKKTQSGFAHVVVLTVILAVALVGTLGFVYWQNFMKPKDEVVKTNDTKDKVVVEKPVANDEATSTEGYLVLEDWGVKFKLPSDLGSNAINYYKSDNDNYIFTTSKIEALGQDCSHDSSHFMPQYYLSRDTSAPNPEAVSSGFLLKKIDNYYFNLNSSQAPCSDAVGLSNVFNTDRSMLEVFFNGIEKK